MADSSDSCEALEHHVEFVERAAWLSIVEERFGIPNAAFDDYFVVRPSKHALHLVPKGHQPPQRPAPQIIGMSFLRTRMRFPKLTTAAAMAFGGRATRNTVGLEQAQADAFLSREAFALTPEQAAACTGTGYVLARLEEVILGVGFLAANEGPTGQLRSMFPKAWTLADDESAFDK
ncbi:MAG: hypothetical protein ACOC9W_01675 [Persicimonas sp.]